ncbi:Heat shock factor binding protein 1 [Phytophthora infestans]|uniref:Heat shock factor binding protein 1 n=1 Tax=Phytophthora infestans TaxID=4787 RepID=A0A833SFD7_PHYIN|nr:Heat shock factor binding protein 1 [Phytophthora infestans]
MSSSEASKNANANSASNTSAGGPTDGQDLSVFVQSLLEQMQSRFAQMSDAIIGRNILFTKFIFIYARQDRDKSLRIWVFLDYLLCVFATVGNPLDEMGSRIDDLEKSIADLMEQTTEDGSDKNLEPATGEAAAKNKGESV